MDIIGFGALNLDKLYRVDKLGKTREKTVINESAECAGGSAANTIAGLAKLGFKTAYVGVIGDDEDGKKILKGLEDNGVNASLVKEKQKEQSDSTLIFVESSGERIIYVRGEASTQLEAKDIDIKEMDKAKYVHFSPFPGDRQFSLQKEVIANLKSAKVSFAPGFYVDKGLNVMREMLSCADILFVNKNELETLTNLEIQKGCEKLHGIGTKIVVVTLGKNGCYVSDGSTTFSKPAQRVEKIVDTTGAGDAFAAGFLAGILRNETLEKCAEYGFKTSAECIKKLGAQTGLLTSLD